MLIGIGNEDRGDDGAGVAVARALAGRTPPEVVVIERGGECADLLHAWRGAHAVIVVDAMAAGAPPGTVRRFDTHAEAIPTAGFPASSHALGLAEAIELARALGELPPRLVVYGIQGGTFRLGAGLSAEVEAAVPTLAEHVLREVARLARQPARGPANNPHGQSGGTAPASTPAPGSLG